MFERILVPLDGSPQAESILDRLSPLIVRERTELLVLQGVYAPPSLARLDTGKLAAEHGVEARGYLDQVVRRLQGQGVRARGLVVPEPPEKAIVNTARAENVGLIAMMSHGRSGVARWIMGSVTEKVLRTAESPLLILHSFRRALAGDSVPIPAEPVSFRSILVPIDPGEASLAVLPWVEGPAGLQPSKVVIFHVRPPAPPPTADAPATPAASPIPSSVQSAEERLRAAGIGVRTDVVSGSPSEMILEAASAGEFDLLAMATHGRSALQRWVMGSIAERILRHCPIPMLVVPSRAGR